MSDQRITVEIVTPERLVYTAETRYIVAQGVLGQIGMLPNHAAMVTALDTGTLTIRGEKEGDEELLFVNGGFLEIKDNHAVVITPTAEKKEEIDPARAEAARHRAEERLAHGDGNTDVERAEAALKRAISRLKIVS